MIRRLGQKLDRNYLEEEERALIERASGDAPHEDSWVMFSPTELLKQYVKEAFAREGIPASDQRIRTWADFRRELARNRLGVLKTAAGGGSFVLRDGLSIIQPETVSRQIEWFEDFDKWQAATFWADLASSARLLRDDSDAGISQVGRRVAAAAERGADDGAPKTFTSLSLEAGKAEELYQRIRAENDARIRRALNLAVNRDRGFLDNLAKLLGELSSLEDEAEDQELEEDDETPGPVVGREAAVSAFLRTVRMQARAEAAERRLGRASRTAKIAEWLGTRSLSKSELAALGKRLETQDSLRRFLSPARSYIDRIPRRYRRFRRVRQSEGRWYELSRHRASDITALELDVVLLAMLRAAQGLFREPGILQAIEAPAYASVRRIGEQYRNQVLVDEATDFSPLQLACMSCLAHPALGSFFACGDFNQRITAWGTRSAQELKWVLPDIEIRPIMVTYRHSRQLNELAQNLVRIFGGEDSGAALPENVNSEGVPPALAKGLRDDSGIANWLARRIEEIEQLTQSLPSIAVLVNAESHVRPVADALATALVAQNIRAVPCPDGQVVGPENDVRVFDIQHIKGLEFEAVFFIGVDQLAEKLPDLFDKFLYVGATRAATYLGLTCSGLALPRQIAPLEHLFVSDWRSSTIA